MTERAGVHATVQDARNERLMGPRTPVPSSRDPNVAEIEERARPRTGFGLLTDHYGGITFTRGKQYHVELHHRLVLLGVDEAQGRITREQRAVPVKKLLGEA
jgi:hypothetical protein